MIYQLQDNIMYYKNEKEELGYLLNLDTNDVYALDDISNAFIQRIDQKYHVFDIITEIHDLCADQVDRETITTDIMEFIDLLLEKGMIIKVE